MLLSCTIKNGKDDKLYVALFYYNKKKNVKQQDPTVQQRELYPISYIGKQIMWCIHTIKLWEVKYREACMLQSKEWQSQT